VALLDGGLLIACGPTRDTLTIDKLTAVYGVSLAAVDDGAGARHYFVRPPSLSHHA
jgi:hypothetical protein